MLLKKYSIRPKKYLSQHFLVSKKYAEIISSISNKRCKVLEIGAGIGSLTKFLSKKKSLVIALEIDKDLTPAFKEFVNKNNVEIIIGDALFLPLRNAFTEIYSNVPYKISSKLLFKIIKEMKFDKSFLVLQKEYGLRLVASPGDKNYGRLTIMTNLYAKVKLITIIPKSAFFPKPEVDSILIEITKKKLILSRQEIILLEKIVKGIFSYKKKTLRNALKHFLKDKRIAEHIGIEEKLLRKRVFQLSPVEIVKITRELKNILNRSSNRESS